MDRIRLILRRQGFCLSGNNRQFHAIRWYHEVSRAMIPIWDIGITRYHLGVIPPNALFFEK